MGNIVVRQSKRVTRLNTDLELHDSKITSLVIHEGTAVLELFAYLNKSEGRPGIDAGIGWTQFVRLTFRNSAVHGEPREIPDVIRDGYLMLSGERLDNGFSVPLNHIGPICLNLEFANGLKMTIRGCGFEAECFGVPSFVEEFDP